MAKYETHKRTSQGRAQTIERRAVRAVKYDNAARTTGAGRTR